MVDDHKKRKANFADNAKEQIFKKEKENVEKKNEWLHKHEQDNNSPA